MAQVAPHLPTLIANAACDADLRLTAQQWFGTLLDNNMLNIREPRSKVSISDAGSCRLALWAKLHDELDIPMDPRTQLSRLDPGTLLGAWYASLAAAALTAQHKPVRLEPTTTFGERDGHIDLLLPGEWVYDFKTRYDAKPHAPPHEEKPRQLLQLGMYALAEKCPGFSIVSVSVAGPKKARDGTPIPYMEQYDYTTESVRELCEKEMERLKEAEADDPPPPDPDKILCWVCDYSACEYNKRRMKVFA